MGKRCTEKRRFRTRLDAMMALAWTQRRDTGERRLYRCPICKGWHLTSQAKRKPSIRRGNGVQGSADPGQPTHLMQPQTVPVTKAKQEHPGE